MPKIMLWTPNREYAELLRLKGDQTWREFLLTRAGLDAPHIKVGRPKKHALDALYTGQDRPSVGVGPYEEYEETREAEEPASHAEMNKIYKKWEEKNTNDPPE